MAGNGNWGGASGEDQMTTCVEEDQTHVGGRAKDDVRRYYDMEYSVPTEEEHAEEEDDGVYVFEYSNPEEEGESYQFTMSVDGSLSAETMKRPVFREKVQAPVQTSRPPRQRHKESHRTKLREDKEVVVSNKSVLQLGEDYSDVMQMNSHSGTRQLLCTICPPPGRLFKRASGLAVHLKQMHQMEGKKTFFCTPCQQSVRTQIELDAHTRRHANQDAVFTCSLCSQSDAGYRGSKWGLRRHLEKEHPGIIPHCNICNKGFKSLMSYLADQFRHVGVSPYYCAKCQIYEMTERGLSVHIKNHNKMKKDQALGGNLPPPPPSISAGGDNSATDDSDF